MREYGLTSRGADMVRRLGMTTPEELIGLAGLLDTLDDQVAAGLLPDSVADVLRSADLEDVVNGLAWLVGAGLARWSADESAFVLLGVSEDGRGFVDKGARLYVPVPTIEQCNAA